MPVTPTGPSKRYLALLLTLSAIVAIIFVTSFRSRPEGVRHPNNAHPALPAHHVDIQSATLAGHPIMPHLANESAKADLGRASWKLFHTIMARFPDTPTPDESTALQSYIHLFVRLYPCGECADHFQHIVDKFPPQVRSRSSAAAWACHVHNEVNKSLGKDIFDCSNIGDFYDCGCAEDEKEAVVEEKGVGGARRAVEKPEMSEADKERMTGSNGREFNMDLLTDDAPLRLEREGWTAGG